MVYRAISAGGEPVALKVLFPPPGAGPELLARFQREAQTAQRLEHPGIVRVLEAGQAGDITFMAMTLVEGQTLADRLAQSGPLDEAAAADIAWQVADALDYAHRQGVIHRDVKPSNILLTGDGRAMLTDFGVARVLDDVTLTRTGHAVGTPAYMAPEQAMAGKTVDARADLYALGVVLYHMVTGRPPFQGSTPQVLHAHVYTPPPAPSAVTRVSRAMEELILQAMAKDISRRFQTGQAMAHALARLDSPANTKTQMAPPTLPGRVLPGRWRWLGLALLPLAAVVIWQMEDLPASPPPTSTPAQLALAPLPAPALSTPTPLPEPTATVTPAPVRLPFPAGTLLKSASPGVFRLGESGVLQHIYDWPTFLAFGFVESDIQTADKTLLDSLPRAGELTRLIQGQDQPLDWVVAGRRWRIERWQTTLAQEGYNGLPASPADPQLLAALPLALQETDMPEGTILKSGGSDIYRLFAGRLLRRFSSPDLLPAYGYDPAGVAEVPDEILPLYRLGPALTQLLRSEESEAVFLIDEGRRQPMPAGEALWALGYGVEDVSTVPADFLAGFPLAPTPAPPAATLAEPGPTPSPPLSPSPTPCPLPLDPALADFLAGRPLQDQLGCPRGEAMTTPAAWQTFEYGLLLWRADSNLIYVLAPDKTWFSTGDTWRDGDAPYDPTIVPPAGFYQPVRGFGKVWRERPGVREALGWANAEEEGLMVAIQEFTGGSAWRDGEQAAWIVLLSDGTYVFEQAPTQPAMN